MIFEIDSYFDELDGKWIRANSADEAREYLHNLDCEYTFALREVIGVPLSDVDYEVSNA